MPKSNKHHTWVNNVDANVVVLAAQQAIKEGFVRAPIIQHMMDLVVSVDNYQISDIYRQGIIGSLLDREKLKCSHTHTYNHFGYDIHDIISVFWEEVFKCLPKAEITGNVVPVRYASDSLAPDVCIIKGKTIYNKRETKCNPIHYLRNRGIMAVRNLINRLYRTNIRYTCDSCGNVLSHTSTERGSIRCPICNSSDTALQYPEGMSYGTRKERKCTACGHVWLRTFKHVCTLCKSDNVHASLRVVPREDTTAQLQSDDLPVDSQIIELQQDADLDRLFKLIYLSLPSNPSDRSANTHTKDIFNILVNPSESINMCMACRYAAPMVCEERCTTFSQTKSCGHTLIPDPNVCCGDTSFSFISCVNYSKKLGEYHKSSISLASRRVKKIREYVKRYIMSHRDDPLCNDVYKLLHKHELV